MYVYVYQLSTRNCITVNNLELVSVACITRLLEIVVSELTNSMAEDGSRVGAGHSSS